MDFETRTRHIKLQKEQARLLRKSRWWQTLCQSASCHYCQSPLTPEEVTMDHVVPVSRGGFSKRGNVVPACKPCNTQKKDMTAVELILNQNNHTV